MLSVWVFVFLDLNLDDMWFLVNLCVFFLGEYTFFCFDCTDIGVGITGVVLCLRCCLVWVLFVFVWMMEISATWGTVVVGSLVDLLCDLLFDLGELLFFSYWFVFSFFWALCCTCVLMVGLDWIDCVLRFWLGFI